MCCSTGVCGPDIDPVLPRFTRKANGCLPLILADGKIISRAAYPDRASLAGYAGIEPYAWIINNSLAATGSTEPLLIARAQAEIEQIREVEQKHAERVVIVPWSIEEPVGPEKLRRLVRRDEIHASAA